MNMDNLAEMTYAAHDPQYQSEDPDWNEYREQLEVLKYEIEEARDGLRVLNAEYNVKMREEMYYLDKVLDGIEKELETL